MIRKPPPALIAAGLIGLAACTPTPASTPSPQPLALAGTQWHFTAIDGKAPVKPPAILTFRDDGIGANVGCNGMGGAWRLEGNVLIAGPLISTQMWCEGVMDQERAIGALLGGRPTVTLSGGTLSIVGSQHSATLIKAN